jgi:uncharacterized protein YneF (UPF0154 family)
MPTTEMIVMVAVTAAVVLAFIHFLRLIGMFIMHRTVQKAVERDPASAESLIARLGEPAEKSGDDRLSTILVAFGIAMIAASVVIGDPGWMHYAIAGALFPLIVGTALWLRLYLMARAQRRAAGK